MYRETAADQAHARPRRLSVDRRYIGAHEGQVLHRPRPSRRIEYKAPPKGATPIATQHRSIYFEPNSASDEPGFARRRGRDRRLHARLREYRGRYRGQHRFHRLARVQHAALRSSAPSTVKELPGRRKYGFPAARMRTVGQRPGQAHRQQRDTPEGREKNRRTDIKVYPNPANQCMPYHDLFAIRKEVSRHTRVALAVVELGAARRRSGSRSRTGRCCRRSRCPNPVGVVKAIARLWTEYDLLGNVFTELVAHRAGLPLVRRHRHSARPADGQLPLGARPRQPGGRAHAVHADHGVPAGLHRSVRNGRGDEGGVPLVRHVLLPAGRGGGRSQPGG